MAWLAGWTYRKSVTLSRASGAVTNYQMKLLVGESSGAVGEDVDCGAKCQTDFDDLRFTASDGTTLLDYWIESISGATPNQLATVWIEFNSIGTGATTFYMYYGKADAAAYSNGNGTFLFFDDFLGASLAAQWDEVAGAPSVSGGLVTLNPGDKIRASGCSRLYSTRVRFRAKRTGVHVSNADGLICGLSNRAVSSGYYSDDSAMFDIASISATAQEHSYVSNEGSVTGGYHSPLTWASDTFYVCEITWVSAEVKFYSSNVLRATRTTNRPNEDSNPRIDQLNTMVGYVDWYFVSQFETTEPAWGAWGAEGTDPGGGTGDTSGFFQLF